MVGKVGEAVTYRSVTSSYNVATGQNTETATDTSVRVRVKGYAPREAHGDIQAGDRKVFLAAYGLSFAPKKGDRLQIGGQWFSVISINRLTLRDSEALYILQVRE